MDQPDVLEDFTNGVRRWFSNHKLAQDARQAVKLAFASESAYALDDAICERTWLAVYSAVRESATAQGIDDHTVVYEVAVSRWQAGLRDWTVGAAARLNGAVADARSEVLHSVSDAFAAQTRIQLDPGVCSETWEAALDAALQAIERRGLDMHLDPESLAVECWDSTESRWVIWADAKRTRILADCREAAREAAVSVLEAHLAFKMSDKVLARGTDEARAAILSVVQSRFDVDEGVVASISREELLTAHQLWEMSAAARKKTHRDSLISSAREAALAAFAKNTGKVRDHDALHSKAADSAAETATLLNQGQARLTAAELVAATREALRDAEQAWDSQQLTLIREDCNQETTVCLSAETGFELDESQITALRDRITFSVSSTIDDLSMRGRVQVDELVDSVWGDAFDRWQHEADGRRMTLLEDARAAAVQAASRVLESSEAIEQIDSKTRQRAVNAARRAVRDRVAEPTALPQEETHSLAESAVRIAVESWEKDAAARNNVLTQAARHAARAVFREAGDNSATARDQAMDAARLMLEQATKERPLSDSTASVIAETATDQAAGDIERDRAWWSETAAVFFRRAKTEYWGRSATASEDMSLWDVERFIEGVLAAETMRIVRDTAECSPSSRSELFNQAWRGCQASVNRAIRQSPYEINDSRAADLAYRGFSVGMALTKPRSTSETVGWVPGGLFVNVLERRLEGLPPERRSELVEYLPNVRSRPRTAFDLGCSPDFLLDGDTNIVVVGFGLTDECLPLPLMALCSGMAVQSFSRSSVRFRNESPQYVSLLLLEQPFLCLSGPLSLDPSVGTFDENPGCWLGDYLQTRYVLAPQQTLDFRLKDNLAVEVASKTSSREWTLVAGSSVAAAPVPLYRAGSTSGEMTGETRKRLLKQVAYGVALNNEIVLTFAALRPKAILESAGPREATAMVADASKKLLKLCDDSWWPRYKAMWSGEKDPPAEGRLTRDEFLSAIGFNEQRERALRWARARRPS